MIYCCGSRAVGDARNERAPNFASGVTDNINSGTSSTATQTLAFGATAVAVVTIIAVAVGVRYNTSGLVFTGTAALLAAACSVCARSARSLPRVAVALQRGRGDKVAWQWARSCVLWTKEPASPCADRLWQDLSEVVTMDVYRSYGIKWLDALLLTHDHADATGGLDELRSLQMYDQKTFEISSSIRCIYDRRTLARLRHCFPYLFPRRRRLWLLR